MGSVLQAFGALHFQFAREFLVALLPIVLTVAVHGQAMHWVARYCRRYTGHGAERFGALSRGIVPIVIVAIMLVAHFAEIGACWGAFYVWTGLIVDPASAMDFSINAYTTLGASHVTLPLRWQGLGGMEAMTAILMFGWSTAVLAVAIKPKFM